MAKGFFVSGTDTDVGKTWVTLGLLNLLNNAGHSTTVMKPVSAGCKLTSEGYRNEDAVELIKHASTTPNYDDVNPYAFEAAIAPHIAAQNAGVEINISTIKKHFDQLSKEADFILVEGAGGWQVPINSTQTMAHVALSLGLPAILVVGMKLGCLNHAILTVENMQQTNTPIAGWIANTLTPSFTEQHANIETLKQHLPIPLLGEIPYLEKRNLQTMIQSMNIDC